MSNIITRWNPETSTGEWSLAPIGAAWDGEDTLFSAVLISLFTDAVAGPDDIIPDGSEDPRGWWGGAIGSKLWLRARLKPTALTLALVKKDIEDALAWFVEDGVAARIEVVTEWTRPGLLGAAVTLHRGDGSSRGLTFSRLWENS
jgi:phage gp46-like protein